MNEIITHTAYDGTITFRNPETGKVIAYAGWAGFIAEIVRTMGWRAYGSPTYPTGDFIAMAPTLVPEDLPLDPGCEGWIRMQVDELLGFAGDEHV